MERERGSTLLYVIASLVVLGAVGAGMSHLSPAASRTGAMCAPGAQARYLALSGLNLVSLMSAAELDALAALGDAGQTYDLGDAGSFTLSADSPTGGQYPVKSTGNTDVDGSREGHFTVIALISPASSPSTMGNFAIASKENLSVVADYIEGNVIGDDVEMAVGRLDGNISASGTVNLYFLAQVNGNICAQGDVNFYLLTEVNGDVRSGRNINAYALVHVGGGVYAVNDITLTPLCVVDGDAVFNGTIINPSAVRGEVISGETPVIDCETADYPEINPQTGCSSQTYTTHTFSGTSECFENLTIRNYGTLTFDLTHGDIEVSVAGNLQIGHDLTVRVIDASGTHTFWNVYDDSFKEMAAGIYFEVGGGVSVGRDSHWLGTIYAEGDVDVGRNFRAIGALMSRSGVVVHGTGAIIRHQPANHFTGD